MLGDSCAANAPSQGGLISYRCHTPDDSVSLIGIMVTVGGTKCQTAVHMEETSVPTAECAASLSNTRSSHLTADKVPAQCEKQQYQSVLTWH